jgi:hypothetical protein
VAAHVALDVLGIEVGQHQINVDSLCLGGTNEPIASRCGRIRRVANVAKVANIGGNIRKFRNIRNGVQFPAALEVRQKAHAQPSD